MSPNVTGSSAGTHWRGRQMPALSTTTRQHVAEGSPNQSNCPPHTSFKVKSGQPSRRRSVDLHKRFAVGGARSFPPPAEGTAQGSAAYAPSPPAAQGTTGKRQRPAGRRRSPGRAPASTKKALLLFLPLRCPPLPSPPIRRLNPSAPADPARPRAALGPVPPAFPHRSSSSSTCGGGPTGASIFCRSSYSWRPEHSLVATAMYRSTWPCPTKEA